MRVTLFSAVCCSAICLASAASAQKLENVYKDWNVFTLNQGGAKTCYIASAPTKKTGNYKKRGEPYMLVTHRSSKVDEVSISSGYPYQQKGEVTVTVDKNKALKLFTKDDLAWAYNAKDDSKLVSLMKKGHHLKARGRSQLNTHSEDTYSLSGFTAAYNRMKRLCK
jgi:invasion protein IalB